MRRRRLAAALTLAFIGVGRDADAGSITQSLTFVLASSGTTFTPYHQFDPALGPLTEVDIAIVGTAVSGNFDFANRTLTPIAFTGTIGLGFIAAGKIVNVSSSFTRTLDPMSSANGVNATGDFSATGVKTATAGSLAYWVGAGGLFPDLMFNPKGSLASANSPAIIISPDLGSGATISGTETVTYLFGPAVPEPASWVTMGLGMVAVVGMGWMRVEIRGFFPEQD